MSLTFEIEPVSKPRQTKSDVWKERPCVVKYRKFADELRKQAKANGYELGDTLYVNFHISMPKSWSKKKKLLMFNMPHQQTPDIDNLVKSFMDAMSKDDSNVWELKARKKWSEKGSIDVYDIQNKLGLK